jgi:hypothetical protein
MDEAKDTISSPSPARTGAAGQRHHRRARQRQRCDGDIHGEEDRRGLLRLQRIEAEPAAKVEREIQPDQHGGGDEDQQLA